MNPIKKRIKSLEKPMQLTRKRLEHLLLDANITVEDANDQSVGTNAVRKLLKEYRNDTLKLNILKSLL